MDATKLGVAPAASAETTEIKGTDGGQDGGQHSQPSAGTADPGKSQAKPDGADGGNTGTDGEGNTKTPPTTGDGDTTVDPKDVRINDLMSKWQKSDAQLNQSKSKLQLYEEKFGPLDGDGKPAPKAPVKPNVDETDPELPDALKPGWQPKSMEELQDSLREVAAYSARKAIQELDNRTQSTIQAQQEAERVLNDFVEEVKSVDPEFDDNVFFKYATDMGFPVKTSDDLRVVYKSYVQLERAKRDSAQEALKNKEKRKDPVSKPGGGQPGGQTTDFGKISKAASAKDLISDMINNK